MYLQNLVVVEYIKLHYVMHAIESILYICIICVKCTFIYFVYSIFWIIRINKIFHKCFRSPSVDCKTLNTMTQIKNNMYVFFSFLT